MRVFVAGGTGAIGRPLVQQLVEGGHEVTVLSRSEQRVADLGIAGVRSAVADALDADALSRVVERAEPEVVVNQLTNLAQTASPVALKRGFTQTSRLRTDASATLVRAARAAGTRRLVAQSIAFAYKPGPGTRTEDDPLWTDAGGQVAQVVGPIAALEAETTGAGGPDGVVLRYGAFYGPGTYYDHDGAFATLIRRRMLPVPGQGRGLFGFVHVDDAARATVAALDGPAGIYNIVDDVPAPAGEWIPLVAELLGAKRPLKVPEAVMRMTAGQYSAYLMCSQPAVSNAKARAELGWVPAYPDWHAGLRAALG